MQTLFLSSMRLRFFAAMGVLAAVGCEKKPVAKPDAGPPDAGTAADAAVAATDALDAAAPDLEDPPGPGMLQHGQMINGSYCIPAERFQGGKDADGKYPRAICKQLPFGVSPNGKRVAGRPEDETISGMHGFDSDDKATGSARAKFPNACCYQITRPPRGRALRSSDGEAILPPILGRDIAQDNAEQERRIAAEWIEAAREEYASVASFSRFSLQLMMFGAPADLIEAAHHAALDEIRHAEEALSVAKRYGASHDVTFGPIDARDAPTTPSIDTMALETFVEGCIGETIAAAEAKHAASLAIDPVVRDVLARVAEDETRHAELAWRTLQWIAQQQQGDEKRALLRDALQPLLTKTGTETDESASDGFPEELERHGILSPKTKRAIRAETLALVIEPCFAHLTWT